ncbi:MAG TPA: DNA starvation/stationary phase protection protein Dps [Acidobacteriota bacterium]|nr:DNA starvation/stationary phase protection protein Dps [Acidobacteriota bacterium]
MYETKNNLQIRTRTQIISLLQDRLADCIDLMNQGKQAHWNVKGPNFFSLHELFDKVSEETEEYVDLIAERIVQLGGIAEGTIQSVSKRSSMPAYPLEISKGSEHVERFSHSLAYFGELARNAINQANEINDADTADIFTEISRGVDKWLWMVEAHNQ